MELVWHEGTLEQREVKYKMIVALRNVSPRLQSSNFIQLCDAKSGKERVVQQRRREGPNATRTLLEYLIENTFMYLTLQEIV